MVYNCVIRKSLLYLITSNTMSLFILQENQKLIWDTINKVPQFAELGKKEQWFREMIQNVYSKNKNRQISVQELRQLNKETISQMITKLKSSTPSVTPLSNDKIAGSFFSNESITDSSIHGFQMNEDKTATRNYMLDQKQEVLNNQFTSRQQEFESMMKREPVKDVDFRDQGEEDKPIENMEELLKKHIRDREYDVESNAPTNLAQNTVVDNIKSTTKNVKWATEIEMGPSKGFVDMDMFQDFVRKTNLELSQLRNELATLRSGKVTEHRLNEPSNMNNILSRLRRTSSNTATSFDELVDVSNLFTI